MKTRIVVIFLFVAFLIPATTSLAQSQKNGTKKTSVTIEISTEGKPRVIGLPEGSQLEYFGRIDQKTFFVIYVVKPFNYETFKCLVGPASALRPVKIKSVNRYRDGGTTYIKITRGEFYFPSTLKVGEKPTFRGKLISVY